MDSADDDGLRSRQPDYLFRVNGFARFEVQRHVADVAHLGQRCERRAGSAAWLRLFALDPLSWYAEATLTPGFSPRELW
jgi:hypothetical protein